MDDYLAIQDLIVDRLAEEIEEATVSDWSDYASMEESRIPTPAIYVIYQGDLFGQSGGRGAVQRVDHMWGVVVVVRNVANRRGDQIRETAGPIMAKVIKALSGWTPSEESFRPLERRQAKEPYYSAVVGYFPLMFSTGVITTGETQ